MGDITCEPVTLPATDSPQFFCLRRPYPLVFNFHGSPGDATMMSTPTGFFHFPRLKVFASDQQQEVNPTILLWPARRVGNAFGDWSSHYLQLISGLLDQFVTEFSIDTNRVYPTGFSQDAHVARDLIAMRPVWFAGAGRAAGWAGSFRKRAVTRTSCVTIVVR
jgi:poly(3-hydroxybutyrate) depolymerase